MNISEIDKNFTIETSITREGLTFYNIEDEPFTIHGIKMIDGQYRRMPREVAEKVSPGVLSLHTRTSGGRVRFFTDSPYIAIHALIDQPAKMSHMAFIGSTGFDLFADKKYIGSYRPPIDIVDVLDSVVDIAPCNQGKQYTINFPLYSGVKYLYVGIKEGSRLEKATDYTVTTPVVFYGSSITQGGCASRPGNLYQNILSRKLDFDYINLGFSGNARAEDAIAEYISELEMSAFVYDYDHNAPSPEYLLETHEKMFLRIREKNPILPILMLSRPRYYLNEQDQQRLEVVRRTYENALKAGDKNVYFVPGPDMVPEIIRETSLVDGTHPNDSGFVGMAYAIEPVLKKMLCL